MKLGTKVKVMSGKKVLHKGEYLGVDALGSHLVGVTWTSIAGIEKKVGQKYISKFHAKISSLKAV